MEPRVRANESQADDSLDEILNGVASQSSNNPFDDHGKEMSQCSEEQAHETRLQYTIQASASSSGDKDDDGESEHHDGLVVQQDYNYLQRDPSLLPAQTDESSEESTFVETGSNPFVETTTLNRTRIPLSMWPTPLPPFEWQRRPGLVVSLSIAICQQQKQCQK